VLGQARKTSMMPMTNIHEHVTAAPATVSVEFRVRKLDVER
jgi:hypothetical protein